MWIRAGNAGRSGTGKKLIGDGDGEAMIAYYCLHELHLLPSRLLALPRRERAFIIAAVEMKLAQEKRSIRQQKRKIQKTR